MAGFKVEGGHRLCGELVPQGAKNEALQILSSVLLTPERVDIDNVPDILDVNKLIELLGDLGVEVSKRGKGSFSFCAANVDTAFLASEEFCRKSAALRGSGMLVADAGKVLKCLYA